MGAAGRRSGTSAVCYRTQTLCQQGLSQPDAQRDVSLSAAEPRLATREPVELRTLAFRAAT